MRKTGFFAYAKTMRQISFAVTAKLISAFVFTTWKVQSLYFLNTKFKPPAIFCGCKARFVSDLVGNPEHGFSHNKAYIQLYEIYWFPWPWLPEIRTKYFHLCYQLSCVAFIEIIKSFGTKMGKHCRPRSDCSLSKSDQGLDCLPVIPTAILGHIT